MNVVCVVQARMGSTRLPGKMLLPLAGKPLLTNLLERVTRATRLDDVVVAFPLKDLDALLPSCAHVGVSPYSWPGDESDLVARYLGAAETFGADLIVRIPGDNPGVEPEYIDEAVQSYLACPQLYVSTMYRHVHDRTYLDGVGAEVFSRSRLQWLDQATRDQPNYREHPHLLFQDQHLIDGWEQYQTYADFSKTIRLDVNTKADYDFIHDIYEHFGNNSFHIVQVVEYLARKAVTT